MSVYKLTPNNIKKAELLVADWQETMIWSCLQGIMGQVYVDSEENPTSAQFVIADFCFFAGIPNEEIVRNKDGIKNNFVIMTAMNEAWNQLIEKVYPENSRKVTRYAIKKEPNVFDRDKLEHIVRSLPKEYEIKLIDEAIYEQAMQEEWSKDLCCNFSDGYEYCKKGLGVAVLCNNQLVAGASSYTVYDKGIEIEIDTKAEYRRKGLATVAGAKLILECLKRNLYPSWDAQNLWSVALAEKLGYHFSHEYAAYEVMW